MMIYGDACRLISFIESRINNVKVDDIDELNRLHTSVQEILRRLGAQSPSLDQNERQSLHAKIGGCKKVFETKKAALRVLLKGPDKKGSEISQVSDPRAEELLKAVELLERDLDQVEKILPQKGKPAERVKRPKAQATKVTRLLCLRDLFLGVPLGLVRGILSHGFNGVTWLLSGLYRSFIGLSFFDGLKASARISLWCAGYILMGSIVSAVRALWNLGSSFVGLFQPHRWVKNVVEGEQAGQTTAAGNVGRGFLALIYPEGGHVVGQENQKDGKAVRVEYTTRLEKDSNWMVSWWDRFNRRVESIIDSYQ